MPVEESVPLVYHHALIPRSVVTIMTRHGTLEEREIPLLWDRESWELFCRRSVRSVQPSRHQRLKAYSFRIRPRHVSSYLSRSDSQFRSLHCALDVARHGSMHALHETRKKSACRTARTVDSSVFCAGLEIVPGQQRLVPRKHTHAHPPSTDARLRTLTPVTEWSRPGTGHDGQCFPNVRHSTHITFSLASTLAHTVPFSQLQILDARPGYLKASLRVEPYNRQSSSPFSLAHARARAAVR